MPAQSAMTGYLNYCSSLCKFIWALLALCWLTVAQAYSPPTTPTQLVIVDAEVTDPQLLIAGFGSETTVLQLQQSDTPATLRQKLQHFRGLQAVHVFSHAKPGDIQLAGGQINSMTLSAHRELIQQLGDSLQADAPHRNTHQTAGG